jgi:phospholipase/carboxylesterase
MAQTDLTWRSQRPAEGFYSSEVQLAERWPIRTFLPTGYEPNYPYPLLVFLHGHGSDEEQAVQFAPRVSRRNYICISLRGTECLGPRPDGRPAYGWGKEGAADGPIEDYLLHAIQQTRRSYHIHSERIYLAGFCEGATLAYRLALRFPEWFAGVISLNGLMPRQGCPLLRLADVRSLKVFIGHGVANAIVPMGLARQDARLLFTAGLDVLLHGYPTTNRIHPDMLRDINRWVMSHVNQ